MVDPFHGAFLFEHENNGKLLGEQFVRINFSIPVNPRLIRVYDIATYLNDGINVIAVEAHNYGTQNKGLDPSGPERCGGFHLYGEIIDKQGNKKLILSDSSWKVSDDNPTGWNTTEFDDRHWKSAKANKNPRLLVTYPDFTQNWRGFSNRLW